VVIPVINEVDDETEFVPPGFTYIRTSSERMSAAAVAVLDSTEHPPPGPTCLAHTAREAIEHKQSSDDESTRSLRSV
jgi:hypothetical protein